MYWCTNNMENNQLKTKHHTCHYFDNIIKIDNFEKSYKNILIYDVLCKTLTEVKPLHIMFDKVDGFIRDYDGTKYLGLFGLEKHSYIYDTIRYLIGLKAVLHMFFPHNYAKSKFFQMMICL